MKLHRLGFAGLATRPAQRAIVGCVGSVRGLGEKLVPLPWDRLLGAAYRLGIRAPESTSPPARHTRVGPGWSLRLAAAGWLPFCPPLPQQFVPRGRHRQYL